MTEPPTPLRRQLASVMLDITRTSERRQGRTSILDGKLRDLFEEKRRILAALSAPRQER